MSSQEMMRTIGWSLIHFLWQGSALGLVLFAVLAVLRSPRARYISAVCTLVAMALAPLITFVILRDRVEPITELPGIRDAVETVKTFVASAGSAKPTMVAPARAPFDWMSGLVCAWLAGVSVFGLRAAGGWLLVRRFQREHTRPAAASLLNTCVALQERLGITRAVRYLQSNAGGSPAVLGWFKPAVVIPVSAVAELSPWQLEAIIFHELAHIQRLDCFVNLFQIATEITLFYHPAVWWVNRIIRGEREHCCDDVAVAACGSAKDYARALTQLETARSAPVWALSANGGALKSRVGRLLGFRNMSSSAPVGEMAAIGILCAAGALFSGTAFSQAWEYLPPTPPTPPVAAVAPAPPLAPTAPARSLAAIPALPARPAIAARQTPVAIAAGGRERLLSMDAPEPPAAPVSPEPPMAPGHWAEQQDPDTGPSYIGGLRSAGLQNLTVEEVIELKIHGVTPEYVQQLKAAGLDANARELVEASKHGITPQFVSGLQAAGFTHLTLRDYVEARIHGVTPEYAQRLRANGFKDLSLRQVIQLKIKGIS